MPDAHKTQNRRAFLQQVPVAFACTIGTGTIFSLLGCASVSQVNTTTTPEGQLLVRRADIGTATTVLLQWPESHMPIVLHRARDTHAPADEQWTAVWARCTHRGCQVDPAADRLSCPCHGSEFAFDGTVLTGPAQLPLARFTVTVSGEYLVLRRAEAP